VTNGRRAKLIEITEPGRAMLKIPEAL